MSTVFPLFLFTFFNLLLSNNICPLGKCSHTISRRFLHAFSPHFTNRQENQGKTKAKGQVAGGENPVGKALHGKGVPEEKDAARQGHRSHRQGGRLGLLQSKAAKSWDGTFAPVIVSQNTPRSSRSMSGKPVRRLVRIRSS